MSIRYAAIAVKGKKKCENRVRGHRISVDLGDQEITMKEMDKYIKSWIDEHLDFNTSDVSLTVREEQSQMYGMKLNFTHWDNSDIQYFNYEDKYEKPPTTSKT